MEQSHALSTPCVFINAIAQLVFTSKSSVGGGLGRLPAKARMYREPGPSKGVLKVQDSRTTPVVKCRLLTAEEHSGQLLASEPPR